MYHTLVKIFDSCYSFLKSFNMNLFFIEDSEQNQLKQTVRLDYMKYKILFSALVILFIFLLTSGTAFAAPVEIRTTDDLMKIDDSDVNLSLDYILMDDLDFTGKTFAPIGSDNHPFTGTFNGNNHTISNITFSDNKMDYVGLFSFTDGASISSLSLEYINLTGCGYVGGLIGQANNTSISNSSLNNSNLTGSNLTGSDLSGSSLFGGLLSSGFLSGGLVGFMHNSSVIHCSVSNSHTNGNVEVDGDTAGNVFVSITNGSFDSKSYAAGDVEGNGNRVNNFVGNMSESPVSRSYTAKYMWGLVAFLLLIVIGSIAYIIILRRRVKNES